ncbi:glycosyltransferase family 4 protein [Novosphingobium sp. YAF33]|uniref:glycosyltransferase family 4 protein n=1 Tax=Novosphingobium sp. YAF33 TaxID=3233082 RepID=UPI003F9C5500
MRILFLAPQPFFVERGTPIAVRLAVEALCRAGHKVDLLVFHGGEDIAVSGLTIYRAARPPMVTCVPIGLSAPKLACDAFLVAAAIGHLIKRRYDIVHAGEEAVFPALFLKMLRRFKLVYDMDSLLSDQIAEKWPRMGVFRPLLARLERWPMRRADLILPVCAAIAERVATQAPGQTIHVLPDAPPPVPAAGESAQVMNLRALVGGLRPIALYVGNLERYQGVDLLLAAMQHVPEQCCSLVIVGGSDRDVAAAAGAVRRLAIADRVHLAGAAPLTHLPQLLEQADILCSPRISGVNTPMKLYAYMQAGRAIMATAIRSHTQVLSDTEACLVDPDDRAMAAGLVRLASDASLRTRLGEAARRTAKNYSLPAYEKRLREAYATLGPPKRGRGRFLLAASGAGK